MSLQDVLTYNGVYNSCLGWGQVLILIWFEWNFFNSRQMCVLPPLWMETVLWQCFPHHHLAVCASTVWKIQCEQCSPIPKQMTLMSSEPKTLMNQLRAVGLACWSPVWLHDIPIMLWYIVLKACKTIFCSILVCLKSVNAGRTVFLFTHKISSSKLQKESKRNRNC